jgi:hypothetical protein
MPSSITPDPTAPQTPAPVGYYCDHSDEPGDARTHHEWTWVEGEGNVFQPAPNTISSHLGLQDYLPAEKRAQRCPRAVPVYAIDAPALLAEIDRLRAERDLLANTLNGTARMAGRQANEIERLRTQGGAR